MLISAIGVAVVAILHKGIMFGGYQSTLNFYLHGKSHFTKTGYEKHAASYTDKTFHENVDLIGKTFMVTGANSGIGKDLSEYLAEKGANVYMVCRNAERGEAAKADLIEKTKSQKIHMLIADVSKAKDVRSMWKAFLDANAGKDGGPKLDGLICNAGTMVHEFTLTDEDAEPTFATQLGNGVYLLGSLAMPTLQNTPDSRLVIVSSGGMLNYPLQDWETLTCTSKKAREEYNGVKWYAYMKRAQVILAEKWAEKYGNKVKVVSTHPGWAETEGVNDPRVFGEYKDYFNPWRSLKEGTEGICWLLACKGSDIKENGGFYLDRKPFPKHVSGLFGTEGSYTKVSDDAEQIMMANLERFIDPGSDLFRPSKERVEAKIAAREAHADLTAPADLKIEIPKFMIKWNVLASMPLTPVGEEKMFNPVENYSWSEEKKCVKVLFNYYRYNGGTNPTPKMENAKQYGYVDDMAVGTAWKLHPKVGIYLPLNLGYLVLACAEDYSWTLIGVPSRDYLWVMTSKRPRAKAPFPWPGDVKPTTVDAANPPSEHEVLSEEEEAVILREALLKAEGMGFDLSGVRMAGWDPSVQYP